MKNDRFTDPEYYMNRELSWLKFNERVLDEAADASLPLFERLKFLSITASNLDEFFMIRVASLKDMRAAGYKGRDIAGMTCEEQLQALDKATHRLVKRQYKNYSEQLLPGLREAGLTLIEHHEDLTEEEGAYVDRYFRNTVYPVLTPMAVDSSRPFPLIRNKTLNIGALVSKSNSPIMKGNDEIAFATVQVPGVLPRIVLLPDTKDGRRAILLEEVIERNMSSLFMNYKILCAHPFRIMRNADMEIDEDDAEDLLEEIEKQVKKRQWGEAIRLEIDADMDKDLLKHLTSELKVERADIFKISGPLDLTFLMKVYGLDGFDDLKAALYTPVMPEWYSPDTDIFEAIRQKDRLVHHPYDSFEPVVQFVKRAAEDKNVLAIKQTLYRVSGNSPIIAALARAAENGKQVSVLVELKARFDEENNIVWARMLEQAGCHVIYGLHGLKTHSKITLIVRREEDGIRRYVHLGTGNYNDATAKLYTDLGLFTSDGAIGEDATAVFNMLSGYSEPLGWNKLSLAPLWLKERFRYLIERETENRKKGHSAYIRAKMNSLCDPDIIAWLYEASAAGVEIDLVIRGICCLKTGIPGISEHIRVRSIVGNFLEHARIYEFCNDGNPEVYLSSADWMPRNLERRVEILFPVEESDLKERVQKILKIQLQDNTKARIMTKDGNYKRLVPGKSQPLCAQDYFCREAAGRKKKKKSERERVFEPDRR